MDVITLWKEHQAEYNNFWKRPSGVYNARDMGKLQWFLPTRVIQQEDKHAIYLSQDAYIEKMAKRFHLTTNIKCRTHIPDGTKFEEYSRNASKQPINIYQQKIGSFLYAAITICPDISYGVARISTFMMNPSNTHMEVANRVIQYLGHFLHSHWLIYPLFCVGLFSHSFVSRSTPDRVERSVLGEASVD